LPKSSLKTDNILKNHFKEPIISSEIDMDKLFDFYRKSYWLNYVSTAKYVESKRWTFVITGDLHLMWLRDSSAQMHPYLYLSSMNDHIKDVLAGMLRMQAFYFHSDPYGTAYYYYFHHALARPDNALKKGEFAYMNFRTFELDSGSYMVWYLYQFWKIHNDNELVREMQYAISEFIRICEIEQYHTEKSEYQSHAGRQFPKVNYTGMVWSGYRPSDDINKLGYNIPQNVFAGVAFKYITEMYAYNDEITTRANKLFNDIKHGIETFGICEWNGKPLYCFEVDGFGQTLMEDDANIPNAISMPYLDPTNMVHDKELYKNTREYSLSQE